MTVTLSPEQQALHDETKGPKTIAELQKLLADNDANIKEVFEEIEVQEPAEGVPGIVASLRSLFLILAQRLPSSVERGLLRDAIRLIDGAQNLFGEGLRTGNFRARPIKDVIEASRPWRAKLKRYGRLAFSYKPSISSKFADVNSSFTLEEEVADLRAFLFLVKTHLEKLTAAGLTEVVIEEGRQLLEEAEGRDFLAMLGIKSQKEALLLRNKLLTYAVIQGRRASAAGAVAFENNEALRDEFESFSFGGVLRKIQERATNKELEETPTQEQPK